MANRMFQSVFVKRGVKLLALATILAFVLASPAMSQGIPVITNETTVAVEKLCPWGDLLGLVEVLPSFSSFFLSGERERRARLA